jgi:hypothetical protein
LLKSYEFLSIAAFGSRLELSSAPLKLQALSSRDNGEKVCVFLALPWPLGTP